MSHFILYVTGGNMHVSIRNAKGFSLVELMVVVAIIGILAAIAVPNFQRFTAKAKQTEAKSALSALYSAEKAFSGEWNAFFTDFRNIGYQPTGNIRYRHGFGGAGQACPAGYVGAGVLAGGTATNFNTSVAGVCVVGSNTYCTEILTPIAPGSIQSSSTVTAPDKFVAEARGDIDGDATVDVWTLDQDKKFAVVTDDLSL
jgi:type IV pilus assembly protein PilA